MLILLCYESWGMWRLCVNCTMTILPLPLLTCATWVLLIIINIVAINLLTKEMRGRDVPLGVPEICVHKFRKWSCDVSKTIAKIMQTQYLSKLKMLGFNLKNNILYKRIFSLWFFHFDHNLKNDDDVFLFSNINQGSQVAYSRMNSLNGEKCM